MSTLSNSTTSITTVNKAVQDAIRTETTSLNKWVEAGKIVRAFYVSPEAFREAKKQFQAEAIIPALDKKYQAWLKINVKDTDPKSPEGIQARENSATARGMVTAYFSKVEKHAFPELAEAKKAEPVTREPSLAFIEDFIKVAKKGQKLESAPFNLVKVMGYMNLALKEMNVVAEADEADEM
jgi:hypothetical protein